MDIHSSETSSVMEESWIQWFCNISGNNLFCEVEKSFIEDSFNLFDLKKYVPKEYTKALDIILDRVASYDVDNEELERAVTLLYGLIHARYIITAHGLETMVPELKIYSNSSQLLLTHSLTCMHTKLTTLYFTAQEVHAT